MEQQERALTDFFEEGSKGSGNCELLGLEVEHFVIWRKSVPVAYEREGTPIGVKDILEHLSTYFPERTYNSQGDLLGLAGEDGSVTLEPSAQLEISCAPYASVADIESCYKRFRDHVGTFLGQYDAHLENWGYQPLRKAEDLSLIPKRRYDFMDAYFDHIHSHGMQMMRASASTQVSVDYADEADAVRKMRVAAALAPILAAIADNTPVFEGEANHTPIRRLALWREVDSLRCGTIPHLFEPGFGFSSYARWLLETPPIFVTRPATGDETGDKLREAFDVSAGEIYADAPLERSDVEHISSMFWPDVRLKQFVEVRPADCIPPEDIAGYVALIKGVFYSENSLSGIEDFVGVHDGEWPLSTEIVTDAIKQVQTFGFDGKVYGHTLAAWEEKVFSLARTALSEDERGYLDALEAFAADKPFWNVR